MLSRAAISREFLLAQTVRFHRFSSIHSNWCDPLWLLSIFLQLLLRMTDLIKKHLLKLRKCFVGFGDISSFFFQEYLLQTRNIFGAN